MAELHALSAAELGPLYRSRALSPVDVLQAVAAHMARWEPQLQATWALDLDLALAQAQASQARWQRGAPLSPLDGVPLTLKENIATCGVALPLGCAATELVPAPEDAPPAARLREAGAVLLGKTTMPDYGMLSSGLSSFHALQGRLTRNPWDLRKNPGGSSAGAGAAAAAGYGPLHVGTDIGGSIRLPAAWCGVVGFKPSGGRIPIQPAYAGRVAGPMTRTVADTALMMATLSQPDWRDATSLPPQAVAWHRAVAPGAASLKGQRIGLLMDAGWGLPLHAEIAAAVLDAARRLQDAGAVVEPLAAFSTREMADGVNTFWRMRSWLDIHALPAERQARVLPFIRDWAAPAAAFSAAQVFHGYSQMAALRDAAVAACAPYDFVLSPVAPCVAFDAEWAMPTGDPQRAMEHIAYTLPFNMSEQPALSLPWGHSTAGLPLAVQVIGRRHDDLGVLCLARCMETLRPPLRPWPAPPA
jgi:Asp-tRNA(Asn)/Glu-tRNA(Gln) amidotransferase A subunit family amidase